MRPLLLAARAPVAAALALLAAALLLAALPPAHADAAAKARRCAKGAVAVRARRGPRLCVRTQAPSPQARAEQLLPRVRAGRGVKRPSAAAKRAALQGMKLTQRQWSAGRALLDAATPPKGKARAASGGEIGAVLAGLGRVIAYERGADGVEHITFEHDKGFEVEATIDGERRYEYETRDRHGAGWTFGATAEAKAPECPAANGDVPVGYDYHFVAGRATAQHGKRTWMRVDVKADGRWLGHVGVGARAERYDLDLRSSYELRGGVEIASTRKVLKRDPTRTYRGVLRKRGIPLGADVAAVLSETTVRTPKGTRYDATTDERPLSGVLDALAAAISNAEQELKKGDRRWYDERACARVDHTWAPSRVVTGGRADWDVTAYAKDGAVVADARWTPVSSCGELTASATSGPRIRIGVADRARSWGFDTGNGACAEAELTTTAGRPQPFSHSIPPEPRRRLQLDISVRFAKSMGPGIAETHMRGSGTVLLGDASTAGEVVMGTGEYDGTEWDQRVDNTCGQDMLATRSFAGRATVGAQRHDDGTITVGFTADQRPFELSWIVVMPATGGTRVIRSEQPFCGQPRMAATVTEFTVVAREVVEER